MTLHRTDEPVETTIDGGIEPVVTPHLMTAEQLRRLGECRVVYLKAGIHDGELAFVLYGAAGTPLVVVDTVEDAVEMAAERGLDFITVH